MDNWNLNAIDSYDFWREKQPTTVYFNIVCVCVCVCVCD